MEFLLIWFYLTCFPQHNLLSCNRPTFSRIQEPSTLTPTLASYTLNTTLATSLASCSRERVNTFWVNQNLLVDWSISTEPTISKCLLLMNAPGEQRSRLHAQTRASDTVYPYKSILTTCTILITRSRFLAEVDLMLISVFVFCRVTDPAVI